MLEFHYDPPLTGKVPAEPFIQVISLTNGGRTIGTARWYVSSPASEGVVQILELTINSNYRRRGHARQLLDVIIQQSTGYFRRRRSSFRRLWICVEQKTQVNGRALLTSQGFHHITTIPGLACEQDALIYMRSFD